MSKTPIDPPPQTANGLAVQIVAREPQIVDPVAARFDAQGRLWVVQMRDYPVRPPDQPPRGRISILRDRDADGVFESSTIFADGLDFPTGLQPWLDGAVVTVSGEVQFLRDTDRDDRCDHRETWLRGFTEENEQLRANHPTLGPDGWIYIAGGLRGGQVRGVSPPFAAHPPVDLAGCDLAVHPVTGEFRAVAGDSQFGLCIDDFGRRLGVTNRVPIQTASWDVQLLARDPWRGPAAAVTPLAASGAESEVRPQTATATTSHLHAGQYSAACGLHQIDSQSLPALIDNVLVCEPTGYLIQRLAPASNQQAVQWFEPRFDPGEAIASTDRLFRPVDITAGPAGVYFVDMQRAVIEHPHWMPAELRERQDFGVGNDRGRIYRVFSQGDNQQPPEGLNSQSPATASEWASRLDRPDGFQRRETTRLWYQSLSDRGCLATDVFATTQTVRGRAAALHWIAANARVNQQILQTAFASPDQDLRCLTVRLAGDDQSIKRLGLRDESATVRRSAVLAVLNDQKLWEVQTVRELVDCLVDLALDEAAPWSPPSLATRLIDNQTGLLRSIRSSQRTTGQSNLRFEAARLAAYHDPNVDLLPVDDAAPVSDQILANQLAEAAGIIEAKRLRNQLADWLVRLSPVVTERLDRYARDRATEPDGDASAALIWIGSRPGANRQWLTQMRAAGGGPVFMVALTGLATIDPSEHVRWCREFGPSLTIDSLGPAVDLALRTDEGRRWFIDSLADETLPALLATETRWKRLLKGDDPSVNDLARQLKTEWTRQRAEKRSKFVAEWNQPGDLVSGRNLFRKHCSSCHVIEGVGQVVGPDISDARGKTKESLLDAIVDPSAAIDAGYVSHQIMTVDGDILAGLLVSRDSAAITLRLPAGKEVTYSNDEILQSKTQTVSLMPDGFSNALQPGQMNDLLHYLKHWRGDTYSNLPPQPGARQPPRSVVTDES